MQLLAHALIVAGVATVLLIVRAAVEPHDTPSAPVDEPSPAVSPAQAPAIYATVVKPFGASVRVAPSPEAPGLMNVSCGSVMPALMIERGWVKVRTDIGAAWISASRVSVSNGPGSVDCSGRRFLYPTADVWTFTPAGCLSLRERASREAVELACVGHGHIFAVVDGPFDPGGGEDWFKVTSPTTGTGWVPGAALHPL